MTAGQAYGIEREEVGMEKKERRIVFAVGLALLLIFTFADLQISLAIAKKPGWARVLEVVGEISKLWMIPPALLMAAVGIWIARRVPAESRSMVLRYAAVALLYFILVILIMNSLKTVWGRMRFREMTDPVNQFTRWYQIVPRGGFNNIYASFPSGHSMNSAGVILLMLLPPMIPALRGREKALHAFVYIWCVLVGISRVFMGAHFSSDVTVGVLLSLAIFEALRAVLCRRAPQNAGLT